MILAEQVIPCKKCNSIFNFKITKNPIINWTIACKCSTRPYFGVGETLEIAIYRLNLQNK